MPPEPLDYEPSTRRQPTSRLREVASYVLFFASAGISAAYADAAHRFGGTSNWFTVVFFGLTAIVVPFLVRGR
jgi:hypothetical protein